MSNYLIENRSTEISNIIFSMRSKTLDKKDYQPWMYENELCVLCGLQSETMQHFMTVLAYENKTCEDWWKIDENYAQVQFEVASVVEKRLSERDIMLDKIEVAWALDTHSAAPGDC